MKRNIAFFFLMAFMNLLGTKAFAYDIAVENDDSVTIYYNYIHAAKELEVTYKKNNSLDGGYSGKVVIPSEVTFKGITRKVTSIGKRAFYHSPYVTEVILPSTVNTICEWAFGEIISLTSLNIPNSVTTIKDCAFGDCRNLTSITIPSSVKIIGQGVFLGCDVLESIEVDAENSVYDSRYGCNAIIESASNTLISGCNKTTLPNDITISASEVRDALADPLNTIVEAIKTTLEKTPPELSADIIDRGIMLTGGGALLRGIDMLVMQQTGMPVHVAKRPLDCVVDGAGKRLSKAMGIQYKHNRR